MEGGGGEKKLFDGGGGDMLRVSQGISRTTRQGNAAIIRRDVARIRKEWRSPRKEKKERLPACSLLRGVLWALGGTALFSVRGKRNFAGGGKGRGGLGGRKKRHL